MSLWDEHQIEAKVRLILRETEAYNPEHHFGRPFLVSYQIAIEFRRRFPTEYAALGKPVGGKGTGLRHSVAQYIARELSARIKDGRIRDIEGRLLSRTHVTGFSFDNDGEEIQSSVTPEWDTTMFRFAVESQQ